MRHNRGFEKNTRKRENDRGNGEKQGKMWTFLLKVLLFSYALTGLLLAFLALLLYKLQFGAGVVSVGIIVIYVSASFLAGWIAGKQTGQQKFLWGMLLGGAYFGLLTLLSLAINQSVGNLGSNFLTTAFLCVGSGTLGGMVSHCSTD